MSTWLRSRLPFRLVIFSFVTATLPLSSAHAQTLPKELAEFSKGLDSQRADLKKTKEQWDHLFAPFGPPWGIAGKFLQAAEKLSGAKDGKLVISPNDTLVPHCKDADLWRLTYIIGNRLGGGSLSFGGCFPEHFKAGDAPVTVQCGARKDEAAPTVLSSSRVPAEIIGTVANPIEIWDQQLHPCQQLFRCCWGMSADELKKQQKDLNTSKSTSWIVPFAEFLPISSDELYLGAIDVLIRDTFDTQELEILESELLRMETR